MSAPSCQLEQATLHLRGEWTLRHYSLLEKLLTPLTGQNITVLNGTEVEGIDTAGAMLLRRHLHPQIQLLGFTPSQQRFLETILSISAEPPAAQPKRAYGARSLFEGIGRRTAEAGHEFRDFMIFSGHAAVALLRAIRQPRRLRVSSITRHVQRAGVDAIPIISLLAFLISIVLAYQGATQLQNFGAAIFTIDLTVISILREMGVLLTAIMVAGRSGSAFAAEIGVMKLREETSALQTLGLEPFEMLVLPRILGLMIALPLLAFIANMVGLIATGVMSLLILDISLHQYLDRISNVITYQRFFIGMVKAPVFAFLIALVGTFQGMRVSGSAASVGRLTTVSVVQAIFLIILADALFSILFAQFKW